MKKMKLIAIIAVMIMCFLTGCAMLGDKVKYSGTCGGEGDGSNLKWTLTRSGVLTISGQGKMQDGGLPWSTFNGELHEKVKSVILRDGITHIGNNAFYYCGTITGEVIIPDTVKSVGSFAFYECRGIGSIKLPSGLERIESNAFRGCVGWKEDINLPETVTFIGDSAFENCENLTGELRFSENLIELGRCAFIRCKGLTGDLILPDSLEAIGDYAFSECENLNGRLKLPNNLETIEADTFSYTGFTGDLIIPESVTKIDARAFDLCKNLNGILTIGNGVREISYDAFYSTNFKEIKFGNSIETIGCNSFSNNNALTGALRFPATLKYIGPGAFERCANISDIGLPDGLEVIADGAFAGIKEAGDTIELPESVWYTGKCRAAFADSCFTNIVYKGEQESDREYRVVYEGRSAAGYPDAEEGQSPGNAAGRMGDEAFVWIPKGSDLIGCGRFADTWLNFEKDILQICRVYRDEDVVLAEIPVERVDPDTYRFQTEEPFEYKGLIFQEFQFTRWKYSAEVCMAYVKDAAGSEQTLLFGDWTESADGMWSAYTHADELAAGAR